MPSSTLLNWLLFLALIAAAVFVAALYREGSFARKSPTESGEIQQAGLPGAVRTETPRQEAKVPPPHETAKQLVHAWNRGSNEDIASLFTDDGTLTIPTGSKIRSKSEIEKTIAEKRQGVLRETTLSNTIDEVSQIDADTAVVKGKYKLDGVKILGFSTSADGTFVFRQQKKDGKWLISQAELRTNKQP